MWHVNCHEAEQARFMTNNIKRSKTNKTMKTVTTIATVLIALGINVTAQVKMKERGVPPKQGTYVPRNTPQNNPAPQNNNQSDERWGFGWGSGWGHPHGVVSVNIGYNPYPYNNYYANGYSLKKATKYSIKAAGKMINQAVAFDSWNDIYSPLLAKAIRHYNYSRELYWWGNYQAAYNHAERARYLAWYSLQYFQNPNYGPGYGGGYEPNPYSDPYNPYYRTDQTGGKTQGGGNEGFKTGAVPASETIDQKLPGSEINDRELIRSFDKNELKDE